MPEPIYYFLYQTKTAFIPFKYVYPECLVLIKGEVNLTPLICMQDNSCHRNSNCAEILANRVNYLFNEVLTESSLLVAYFKYEDKPDSIRAGIFHKDMREPYVITCNKSAFKKFQREGDTYRWFPPTEYTLMAGAKDIISPDRLIRE